jgi:hypothetical protein
MKRSFSSAYAPDLARFSLTQHPDSVILKSLRGVVPVVLLVPGPVRGWLLKRSVAKAPGLMGKSVI